MESKIIWSDEAIADLGEISEFISHDNPERAASFCQEIIEHAELLVAFPKKGRIYSKESGEIRITHYKLYSVFYRYDEKANVVIVLNVWHGARLPPEFD